MRWESGIWFIYEIFKGVLLGMIYSYVRSSLKVGSPSICLCILYLL